MTFVHRGKCAISTEIMNVYIMFDTQDNSHSYKIVIIFFCLSLFNWRIGVVDQYFFEKKIVLYVSYVYGCGLMTDMLALRC